MDSLRIILLILGVLFVAGIYWWETRWRKRSRSTDPDDLDTSYLDEIGGQRSRRDFGYTRSPPELANDPDPEPVPQTELTSDPEPEPAVELPAQVSAPAEQADLPFDELVADDNGELASDQADDEPAPLVEPEPVVESFDFIVPGRGDDEVDAQVDGLGAFSAGPAQTTTVTDAPESLVIALTLMAPGGEQFDGEPLRGALEDIGFRHGHMQVFHYYEGRESGRRDPLCSIANVLNPGKFDLQTMHELQTPGLALFMQVSGHGAENARLDRLIELGEALAERLGGELMDETRSTLTHQAINHLREKIAEFSRQQRIRR